MANCNVATTYTLKNNPDSGSVPSIFTISSNVLQITQPSAGDVNTYNLQVVGEVSGYHTSTGITFSVTLTNKCTTDTITTNVPADQTYTLSSSASTFSFSAWTIPESYCGTFSYASAVTSPASPPTSWLTHPHASDDKNFQVQSTTISDAQVYTVTITGTLSGNSRTQTATFQVTITNPCTVAGIVTQTPGTQSYTVNDSAHTFGFTAWSISPSDVCGTAFTYAITQTSPTSGALPSFVTNPYSSDSKQFSVHSTAVADANTYTIQIVGTATTPSLSKTITFTLNVLNPCSSATISPSSLTN